VLQDDRNEPGDDTVEVHGTIEVLDVDRNRVTSHSPAWIACTRSVTDDAAVW
jgi:hypothetical protein